VTDQATLDAVSRRAHELAEQAPPLTEEQRALLRVLLGRDRHASGQQVR
jgi:hypothetical protein